MSISGEVSHQHKELELFIHDLNKSWMRDSAHSLGNFFHEDMVMVSTDFTKRMEGKEACVKSYRDFAKSVVIDKFSQSDFHIDVTGDTAVISYHFKITFESHEKEYEDEGRDLFVLKKGEFDWKVIWRSVVSYRQCEITKDKGIPEV